MTFLASYVCLFLESTRASNFHFCPFCASGHLINLGSSFFPKDLFIRSATRPPKGPPRAHSQSASQTALKSNFKERSILGNSPYR
ncbi:hypothetical protein BC939DRAFT_450840 [Gamsiella multidivaricata]|uniref:uncharacterized protein n=1 Tax=Gamsiella multidivaricata TaxID=101098 RepID=UPI00221FA7FC|nr:uncharacterized protein BC939DRAFT_450840 [Gamsiella multidivaricata]KAI7823795.1 hypothetical protein BC939DRAFT_450840 [Gamsiella multidivaricata]